MNQAKTNERTMLMNPNTYETHEETCEEAETILNS